jgi:hypothetical protein
VAFETLKTKLWHYFRTVSSLSRAVRRSMRFVVDKDNEFRTTLLAELGKEAGAGNAQAVLDHFLRDEHDLGKADVKLLDGESKIQAIQITFQELLDGLPAEFGHLRDLVKRTHEASLLKPIEQCEARLHEMFEQMLAGVHDEYLPLVQQAKEERDNWFTTRARGIALLARAMNDVYQLRQEWADVKGTVNNLHSLEKEIASLVAKIVKAKERKNAEDAEKHMVRCEQALTELVAHLVVTVEAVYNRFKHIMRVFVLYSFVLLDDRDALGHFLTQIKAEKFPPEFLAQLQTAFARGKQERHERAEKLVHVGARLRHVEE